MFDNGVPACFPYHCFSPSLAICSLFPVSDTHGGDSTTIHVVAKILKMFPLSFDLGFQSRKPNSCQCSCDLFFPCRIPYFSLSRFLIAT